MKKLFKRLFTSPAAWSTDISEPDLWADPALARMSERELADLPFPREPRITGHGASDGCCA